MSAKHIFIFYIVIFCLPAWSRPSDNKPVFPEALARPLALLETLSDKLLKKRLQACRNIALKKSDFVIGHRGAPLHYPEHTRESYMAAARLGAGIIECDVTFTRDRQLVCRHSQCDLHTTTNILEIPQLARKCSKPFSPWNPLTRRKASARCCTTDITLKEFRLLKGKPDVFNPEAKTIAEYMQTPKNHWKKYFIQRGTLMTHRESIELFKKLGVKMIPELKKPQVTMPWLGHYTQQQYAQQLIDEYKQAGVNPQQVFLQSFLLADIQYWIRHEPAYAKQAVFLDNRVYKQHLFRPTLRNMKKLKDMGVNYIAPPIWALLRLERDKPAASRYANVARQAGLKLITWTFERSDLRNGGFDLHNKPHWYYKTVASLVKGEGDKYRLLEALINKVGITGIFTDWPATVSYYINCTNPGRQVLIR